MVRGFGLCNTATRVPTSPVGSSPRDRLHRACIPDVSGDRDNACSRSRVLRLSEHDVWVRHLHGPWLRRAITAPSQPPPSTSAPPTQPTTLPVTVAPVARFLLEASVLLGFGAVLL